MRLVRRARRTVLVSLVTGGLLLVTACDPPDITFTVNSTVDARDAAPGNGVCEATTGAGNCTLRAAVDEANAQPTKKVQVNLAASTTYTLTRAGVEDANSTGDLDVSGHVRITGDGSVIDAGGLDRAFDVTGYLRLTTVTVRNGSTTSAGGGIRVRSGSADVAKATVTANVAAGNGGGIAVVAGSVSVNQSTISSNSTAANGGGIHVASGASANVRDSTISGNSADPGAAGAAVPPAGTDGQALADQPAPAAAPGTSPVEADGSVHLIVRLDVPLESPGTDRGPRRDQVLARQAAAIEGRADQVLGRLQAAGAKVRVDRRYSHLPFLAVTASPAEAGAIAATPGVVAVTPDTLAAPTLAQSIPFINADDAHAVGARGAGWAVAVVDSGVDADEPMTAGKVVAEACFARGADGSLNGTGDCPNGSDSQTGAGSGTNCSWLSLGCGHGTHVASIAAGGPRTISGVPVSGVADEASIVSVRVFSHFTGSANCGSGVSECILSWSSDQLAGLNWVYGQVGTIDLAAVNMSLGGGAYSSHCDGDALKTPIDLLKASGVATVIASGNSGSKTGISSPACISTAISVGATLDNANTVASYSQSASILDLLAPGSNISAEYPTDPANPGADYTATMSGTSMATPHVAGAIAVLRAAKPSATVDQIRSALETTGVPVTDTNGITKPRIDVFAALEAIGPGGRGGGISNEGTVSIVGSTVTANSAWFGSGIDVRGQTGLGGSIVGAQASGTNCDVGTGGSTLNWGYDLVSDSTCVTGGTTIVAAPVLGSLAANGGPTLTHLPAVGSPARNAIPAGTAGLCDSTRTVDQRGVARPASGACDVGAVET